MFEKLPSLLLALTLAFGGLSLGVMSGCEDDNPIEEAGENIGDAVEDVGDELEDAVE